MNDDLLPTIVGPGIEVPDALVDRFRRIHGEDLANTWLARLPQKIAEWCARWEIELETGIPQLNYNLVLFGTSKRAGEVVLKLSPAWFEARAEMEALKRAAGDGIVKLIDADPDFSLIMLERVQPGSDLRTAGLSDEDCTRIAADAMVRFWRPPPADSDLISLEQWSKSLFTYDPNEHRDTVGIPADLILTAQQLGRELLATQTDPVVLHGDLHHQNILWSAENGWTTIDPKGLVGDRGFEVGTWMRNPWGATRDELLAVAERRLDQLSDLLEYDRHRLAQWAAFFAVLSLCWTEDETPGDTSDEVAFIRGMMHLLD